MFSRASNVFFCLALTSAMLGWAVGSSRSLGASLPDATMDSIFGASDTQKLIGTNTQCSVQAASPPQVPASDCPGNCVEVGPPLPCIECDNDDLTTITQSVPSGGNWTNTNVKACGAKSLGGCESVATACICTNLIANGVCQFNQNPGMRQNN